MLNIKNLSLSVEAVKVVSDLSLEIDSGTVVACMGPNGSGKSSLANALAGHPSYTITNGTLLFNGDDITQWPADKRARAGLFLSMQHPIALPGVSVNTFLKEAFFAQKKDATFELYKAEVKKALATLKLPETFMQRSINEGFSGGEKKRCEVLQLLVLHPKLALLDEIDSGLDVDALKCVGHALKIFMQENPESSLFLITHYQKILEYIKPDRVHVLKEGHLLSSGDAALADTIAKGGYDQFVQK